MADRAPMLPAVCRMLDILAIVFILLSLNILLTGGFREWTPFGRLSMTSAVRPLLIGALLVGVRHWLWRRPTIFARVGTIARGIWLAADVRTVLPIVISTRLGVFIAGFLAIAVFGHEGGRAPWRYFQNEFLNLPARWDTGWYLEIAIDGYSWDADFPDRQQNIVFFPLYPMLMRYGSLLLGRETLWTGVLISWLSFAGALIYLYRLARDRFGDEAASAAVALLACYPFAYFYSTAYTESLFLLTVIGACYHFERDELWRAGVWGLAAGLTRPNGCLLSLVLVLIAMRSFWRAPDGGFHASLRPADGWGPIVKRLAFASAPGIGMVLYAAYVYGLTGNPLQWATQNAAWGRVYRGLDDLVAQHVEAIRVYGVYSYLTTRTLEALQAAAVLFALTTIIPVFRRLGVAYGSLIVVNLLPPLLLGGLLSMGRLTSTLFPIFIWLGAAIPKAQRAAWIAMFAMLQAMLGAMFFTWRQLY